MFRLKTLLPWLSLTAISFQQTRSTSLEDSGRTFRNLHNTATRHSDRKEGGDADTHLSCIFISVTLDLYFDPKTTFKN